MTRKFVTIGITLLLFTGIGLRAEERESDHHELRKIMKEVTRGVNERDLEKIKPYLAKEFVITMVDQTVVTSYEDLAKYFTNYFEAEDALLENLRIAPEASVLTVFAGENLGFDYGISTDTYTLLGGEEVVITSHWTATVVKEQGKWKLLNIHIGVSLIDNPIIEMAQSVKYFWGIAGLFIGAILILLLNKVRSKK